MAPLLVEKEGVSITIYSREHLPPHIHAFYGDDEALITIRTGVLIAGELPGKKLRLVLDWLEEGNNRVWVEENFYELNPRLRPVAKNNKKGDS
ncbi:MAG: hypothetical protein K0R51_1403 [Cytophagaceae bacterium]|jgi:hypothetical protein|nr:hypothetical protein [Cytophagaceae bacterium]